MRKRYPSIPATRDKNPTVEKIKEMVEIWVGDRGDKLDRVVTYRDLVGSKLGRLSRSGGLEPGDTVLPSPVYVGPLFDLQANPSMNFIILSWDGINQTNYAYTEIWRASDDNLGNAVLTATTPARVYADAVGSGVGYYYWVRAVSTSGDPGPYNATAGTYGETPLAPSYIIEQIEGLISESELALELLTPIQAIPTIQDTLVDHDSRLDTIQVAVNEVLNLPEFDSAADYEPGDTVKYNGYAWRALVAMTAPSPTPVEGASWTQIGAYQTYDDLLSANAVAISDNATQINVLDGQVTAISQDVVALQAEMTAVEGDAQANSLAIGTLESRTTAAEGNISANSSDITLLQNAVSDPSTGLQANADALNLLDSRVVVNENGITALNQDVTNLQSQIDTLDVDGNAQALQALETRVETNEDNISSLSSSVTSLGSTVGDNTAALQTKAETSVVQGLDGEVTDIKAQFTIKTDVNGYMAGIGLMNDGATSEFIVASDAAYFIDPGQSITEFDPNTNYSSMDALRDTQFVFGYAEVEGQKRFAINVPAYIPEAYITDLMVESVSADKIFAASGTLAEALIGDAEITNAMITNVIQSNNYTADVSGWIIQKSGYAEFNNIRARGHIEADSGYIAGSLQIGGTSRDLAEVVAMAEAAGDTSIFENWIRPGTTLINGNRIYTGDAYVDTLQIKGQAVTVPASSSGSGSGGRGTWGGALAAMNYNHGESSTLPIIVNAGISGFAFYVDGGATTRIDRWRFRLVVNGSQRYLSEWFQGVSTGNHVGGSCMIKYDMPSGTRSIYVQAEAENGAATSLFDVTISVIGCKR